MLPPGGECPPNAYDNDNARTLTIASTLEMYELLTNNGTIQVNSGRTLRIYDTFIHNGTSASISGSLLNAGTVTVNTGKTLTINAGAYYYHDEGTLTADGSFVNNGNIVMYSGSLTANDNWTFNSGIIDLSFGYSANFIVDGDFTIPSSGSLSGVGTVTVNAGKTLTNEGVFDRSYDGAAIIRGTLLNEGDFYLIYNSGMMTIENGGTFTHNGDEASIDAYSTLINNGTVNVNAGKTLTVNGVFNNNSTFNHNGNLGGTGTIGGTSSFSNPSGGTVAPGNSPGCLTFSNGLASDGTINVEVNGTTACSQFDRITVTGTATLGGTLNVAIGYTPTNGDVITFLDATSISGTFASINPPLPSGWSLAYNTPNTGEVSLQFTLLPVELVSFQAAMQKDKTALLTWRTASELNNEGFDIERSADGRDWESIAFTPGHGTTHEEQSYTYTDEHPLPSINYYRLRQVDFDGKFEYSDIRSVVMKGGASVQVYPNPPKADGLQNINFAAEPEGAATLLLFDTNGKTLHRQTLTNQYNQTSYGHLPAGIYFIEVRFGQDVWQELLVVQ